MLPGLEMMACTDLAVPAEVMSHVARVESAMNPYAIGVVGGRLVRQPKSLDEALSTARMLEDKGYNFSLGIAQVNRYNLAKYGLDSYEKAFQICPNVVAGSQILAECYGRSSSDWGKAFSCYYSGNFVTGYRHGYVQKVYASIASAARSATSAIPLAASTWANSRGIQESAPGRMAAAVAVDATMMSLSARRGSDVRLPENPNYVLGRAQEPLAQEIFEQSQVVAPEMPAAMAPPPSQIPYQLQSAPIAPGPMQSSNPQPQSRPPVQTQLPVTSTGGRDSALVF